MVKRKKDGFVLIKFYHIKHVKKNNFYLNKIRFLISTHQKLDKGQILFFCHASLLYGMAFGLLLCCSNTKLTFSMTSLINLQELFLLAAYIQNALY